MLIAQISDAHLVDKDQHWLSHPLTQTAERLNSAISYLNALKPRPDVVVMTGDATESGSANAYNYLKEILSELQIPYFVIPGNHDLREQMRAAFRDQSYMPEQGYLNYVVDDFPVRMIFLDTLVEGKHYGQICEERFSWLKNALNADSEKPTVIFMHHPPAKVGVELFDNIICYTPSGFENFICSTPCIIGMFAGHFHHLCLTSYGGKLCYLAPSLAPVHYFEHSKVEQPTALELEDPAVTLHQWHGGTVMVSHIKRVKQDYKRIPWKELSK